MKEPILWEELTTILRENGVPEIQNGVTWNGGFPTLALDFCRKARARHSGTKAGTILLEPVRTKTKKKRGLFSNSSTTTTTRTWKPNIITLMQSVARISNKPIYHSNQVSTAPAQTRDQQPSSPPPAPSKPHSHSHLHRPAPKYCDLSYSHHGNSNYNKTLQASAKHPLRANFCGWHAMDSFSTKTLKALYRQVGFE